MHVQDVSVFTTRSMDVQNVSLCNISSTDLHDVSVFTTRSMDVQGVSLCNISSMDVQDVSLCTTNKQCGLWMSLKRAGCMPPHEGVPLFT
jgi:hypothetical protein